MKLRQLSILFTVGVLLLALSAVGAQDMTYNEAPMLTDMVNAGEIPPVGERLPANPLVVDGLEIGEYGGIWRRAMTGSGDGANLTRTVRYEPMVRWDATWSGEIVPGVAERWEVSEDSTQYTFYLREGMKWSDGDDFNADDIMFWYEDVIMNEDLRPGGTSLLRVGGSEMAVVEKVDDYTVTFTFPVANGLFLQRLASPSGMEIFNFPAHYASQFHLDYIGEEEMAARIEEGGYNNWMDYFGYETDENTTLAPTLDAWVQTERLTGDTTLLRLERNPYYWKVDSEGNQYPYLDGMTFSVIPEINTMVLQAGAGELDMQARHINGVENRAFFFDNQEAGDYRFFEMQSAANNSIIIMLNLTHPDPVKREIFRNKDFRIALSHAINRQEMIDTLYVSQGIPHQSAPLPGTTHYHEQLATQYLEYDPELANQILDEAGFAERDADGFRLGPDGNRISFVMIFAEQSLPAEAAEVVEFLGTYWRAIGIDMQSRPMPRAARADIVFENQHDATIWVGESGIQVYGDPRYYMANSTESLFARAWSAWFVNPNDPLAEEPDNEGALRQMELYNQLQQTADPDLQFELMSEILDIAAEEFWAMGISTPPPVYGIVRNNFFNVPEGMPFSWEWPTPSPANTFTFFIRN